MGRAMLSARPFLRCFVVAAGLTLAMVACGDAGGRAGESFTRTASSKDVRPYLFANDQAAYDYFVGKGLAPFQAAGIVGNLDQESGVDPSAVQSGGPGRGIAQWSVGGRWDTDSGDNATAYAAQQGQSVWSLQLQLDFIWYELTTFSGYGLAALQATTNVTDATVTFETDFEGCGQCDAVDAHLLRRVRARRVRRSARLRRAVRQPELPAGHDHARHGRGPDHPLLHRAEERRREDLGLQHPHRHDRTSRPFERLRRQLVDRAQPSGRGAGHGASRRLLQVHLQPRGAEHRGQLRRALRRGRGRRRLVQRSGAGRAAGRPISR